MRSACDRNSHCVIACLIFRDGVTLRVGKNHTCSVYDIRNLVFIYLITSRRADTYSGMFIVPCIIACNLVKGGITKSDTSLSIASDIICIYLVRTSTADQYSAKGIGSGNIFLHRGVF